MWLAVMFAFEAAGTLDVSDTARVYAYESATSAGEATALDIENTPRLHIGLEWPVTLLEAEYAPRLFWQDIGGVEASPTLLLHSGGITLFSRRERLSLTLTQTFSVGAQSFARPGIERVTLEPEPGATPAPTGGTPLSPELLPGPTVVNVVAVESSARLRYDWSRRVSTELRPSFAVSGGADAAAQRALPRQRTARVDGVLDYTASRRVSNGYDHRVVSLMETWSRNLAPESGVALGGGVALQETTGPAGFSETQWQPIGAAGAWHTVRGRAVQVHLRSDLGYQPHVNVLTGSFDHRLFASAGATTVAGSTSIALTLGATQTFPLDAPDTAQSLSADLVLEQALLDWLSAELGAQMVWQSLGSDSPLAFSDSRWLLFAGARGELPSVRF